MKVEINNSKYISSKNSNSHRNVKMVMCGNSGDDGDNDNVTIVNINQQFLIYDLF